MPETSILATSSVLKAQVLVIVVPGIETGISFVECWKGEDRLVVMMLPAPEEG